MNKQQQLLEQAIHIALQAHLGEADKGGNPYVLHPLRVMLAMETTEEKIVAVLHDVIEDSSFTIEELKQRGFSKKVLDAVTLLTKKENQNYQDYISAIKKNPLVTKVKLSDLKDNMNTTRLKKVGVADKERLRKYKAAYKFLTTTN